MSKTDCGNHGSSCGGHGTCGNHGSCGCGCRRRKFLRRLFWWSVAIIATVLLVILIVWAVLRPTKPKFFLKNLTVLQFNLTAPPANLLTTMLQPTIATRNPNDRIGIYYDRAHVFVTYKNQQVTAPAAVPRTYQGHNGVDIWSPYLFANQIPVAPYLCDALSQDYASGYLMLYVKVDGRVRWKVGTWVSGHYHLYVTCPAFLAFQKGGQLVFQQVTTCNVEV